MSIELEILLQKIIKEDDQDLNQKELVCNKETINKLAEKFKRKIGFELDKDYLSLMEKMNGVFWNGMRIYPIKKTLDDESIMEMNEELRDSFENYIFYANYDEELYCYHIELNEYHAIAYDSDYPWKNFNSIEDMFIYVLKRSLYYLEDE